MRRVSGPRTTESIIFMIPWSFQARPRSFFLPFTLRRLAHPTVTADSSVLVDRPARRCSVNDRTVSRREKLRCRRALNSLSVIDAQRDPASSGKSVVRLPPSLVTIEVPRRPRTVT